MHHGFCTQYRDVSKQTVNETYADHNYVNLKDCWGFEAVNQLCIKFVNFNKNTHVGGHDPAMFLTGHSQYRIALFFELCLWGKKYI